MTVEGVFSNRNAYVEKKKIMLILYPQTYNNKVNIIVPTAYWFSVYAYVTWFYCVQYLQFRNFQN